jgi:hypothetical protein
MRLKTCLGCGVVVLASLWLSLAHAADKAVLFRECLRLRRAGAASEGPLAPVNVLVVVGDTIQTISAAAADRARPADADLDACRRRGGAR